MKIALDPCMLRKVPLLAQVGQYLQKHARLAGG